jgi:ABC-type branched-chain amino acid transport system, permease component
MKQEKFNLNPKIIILIIFVIAFTAIIPMVTTRYLQTVINSALIYFISALGMSVMLGMGGQVSFATVAFMGIGAYTTAFFSTKMNVPPLLSFFIAIVVCGIASLVLGLILFRLKSGAYVTFATIALVQIMYSIFCNWRPVTGGADGTSNIPDLDFGFIKMSGIKSYFYLLVVISIILAFVVERFRKTSFGRSLASIRDNEIAAQTLGVNVYRTKVQSFVLAGIFAGIAGALMAHQNHFISSSPFTFDQATNYIIMVMLGGVGSTPGVFVGTMLITLLPEWLRPLQEHIQLIYGLSVILLMVFMPTGLAGLVQSLQKQYKNKKNAGGKNA